jgi:uncharacterized membrane protein YgaE (UPF0421/DUF939 family)
LESAIRRYKNEVWAAFNYVRRQQARATVLKTHLNALEYYVNFLP